MPDNFVERPVQGPAGIELPVGPTTNQTPSRDDAITNRQPGGPDTVAYAPTDGDGLPDLGAPNLEVLFSHPQIPETLRILTGLNDVYWAYTLNTVTIPTYGGEVIQILSVGIDDLIVSGQVLGYGDIQIHDNVYAGMESIYKWFLNYAQMATQGALGPEAYNHFETGDEGTAFNQEPVTMTYPQRGWRFQMIPKSLPGFHYGRDVVAPTWMMQGAIVQPDPAFLDLFDMTHLENQQRLGEFIAFGDDFNGKYTGWVTAGIGYNPENPFSAPYKGDFSSDKTGTMLDRTRDYFNKLIPSYLEADFETLAADFSRPVSNSDLSGNLNFEDQNPEGIKIPSFGFGGQKVSGKIRGGSSTP